jgi:hypothetical protein
VQMRGEIPHDFSETASCTLNNIEQLHCIILNNLYNETSEGWIFEKVCLVCCAQA